MKEKTPKHQKLRVIGTPLTTTGNVEVNLRSQAGGNMNSKRSVISRLNQAIEESRVFEAVEIYNDEKKDFSRKE